MTEVKPSRPTCVIVISWFWIIVGVIMAFSALMGALAFMSIRQMPDHKFSTLASSHHIAFFSFLLRHFIIIAFLQIGIAIVSITAGINFLRLRSWARTVLGILSWLCLPFVFGFGFFWLLELVMKMPESPTHTFSIISLFMSVLFTAFYSIPLIVIIHFLRSKAVRAAVS